MRRLQAGEQDLLIWDSEIRRLSIARGEEGRRSNKTPATPGQPAPPVHTMSNPSGTTQHN